MAFRWSTSGAPRLEIEILSCRALRVCPSYARPASAYYEQKAMEMDLHRLHSRQNTAVGSGVGVGQGLGRHGHSRVRPPSPRLGAARCR